MPGLSKSFKWLYHFLASNKLTLILFFVLCIILIPGTFTEKEDISLGIPGSIIFGCISLNLILCTVRRIKTLAASVITIHIGTILTFAGVAIGSLGYVATVNVYEGTSVDTVYRWDKEQEAPLGVDLMVKKIHLDYYPAMVKVGVLKGEEKTGLFVLKTGESFKIDKYTVKVDSLELPAKNLRLSVYNEDQLIGAAQTSGAGDLPADFPYEFKLVAYQDSPLMSMWVELELLKDTNVVAEGISAVNSPMEWKELNFYHVKVDYDEFGNPYAGLQITYDPGLYYVYSGFVILGIGCIMFALRRLYGRRL